MPTADLYVKYQAAWEDDPTSEDTPVLAVGLDQIEQGIYDAYYDTIHVASAATEVAAKVRGHSGQTEDIFQVLSYDGVTETVMGAWKADGSIEIGQSGLNGTANFLFRSGIDVVDSHGIITTPAGSVVGRITEQGDFILGLNAGGWDSGSSQSDLNNLAFHDLALLQKQRGKLRIRSLDQREVGDSVDTLLRRAGDSGYPDGPVVGCVNGLGIGHVTWLAGASAAGDPNGTLVTWGTPGQMVGSISAKTREDAMQLPGDSSHSRVGGSLLFNTGAKYAREQSLTVTGTPTGGTFTLSLEATSDSPGTTPEISGAVAFDSTAAALQTVLEAMSNFNPGDITVTGGPFPAAIVVTFLNSGRYKHATFPALALQTNSLTGGSSPSVTNTIDRPPYDNRTAMELDHYCRLAVYDGVGHPDLDSFEAGTILAEYAVYANFHDASIGIGPLGPAGERALVANDVNLYRSAANIWKTDDAFCIGGSVGFYGTTPATKRTVTGSRGGNAALASLLTGLATLGLITDSSS